ncbi:hypothetical protein KKA18_03415 [Patescibacteria group bacterium]|nr:hypothetical protein [Patescibacteria group bacterium]
MAMNWTNIYRIYKGKWIALKSDEKTVIASGLRAPAVYKKAMNSGYKNPILSYVPVKLVSRIGYNHEV